MDSWQGRQFDTSMAKRSQSYWPHFIDSASETTNIILAKNFIRAGKVFDRLICECIHVSTALLWEYPPPPGRIHFVTNSPDTGYIAYALTCDMHVRDAYCVPPASSGLRLRPNRRQRSRVAKILYSRILCTMLPYSLVWNPRFTWRKLTKKVPSFSNGSKVSKGFLKSFGWSAQYCLRREN